jgi:hypothetical protein
VLHREIQAPDRSEIPASVIRHQFLPSHFHDSYSLFWLILCCLIL